MGYVGGNVDIHGGYGNNSNGGDINITAGSNYNGVPGKIVIRSGQDDWYNTGADIILFPAGDPDNGSVGGVLINSSSNDGTGSILQSPKQASFASASLLISDNDQVLGNGNPVFDVSRSNNKTLILVGDMVLSSDNATIGLTLNGNGSAVMTGHLYLGNFDTLGNSKYANEFNVDGSSALANGQITIDTAGNVVSQNSISGDSLAANGSVDASQVYIHNSDSALDFYGVSVGSHVNSGVPSNHLFYSTTANKLAYNDPNGTIHYLY